MSAPMKDAQPIQREEAALGARFMASDGDLWAWLAHRLEQQRRALIRTLATLGAQITHDDRLIIIGKLALIEDTLGRPSALITAAEAAERQLATNREAYKPSPAPIGAPGPV